MDNLIETLSETGLIPVAVLNDSEKAVFLANALRNGGINAIEVTFRTTAAAKSIANIKKSFPDMIIGAGTIRDKSQAEEALGAGASFVVSPGFSCEVVKYCLSNKVAILPGCITPTEIEQAYYYGITALKFFPAEAAGGIEMLKSLISPYRNVRFMPTGGINLNNIESYLSLENVFACGGSWITDTNLIRTGNFDEIEALTAKAAALVKRILNRKSSGTI
jgi:2-dehydro-3-deoxyphosphogluconate aldolase / (4S)-4-hydroxy-2-oxoglutarate aldolase